MFVLCSGRKAVNTQVVANGKKTDISKQGLSGVKNDVVRRNLEGVSKYMDKKGWVDAQGNKGKVSLLSSLRLSCLLWTVIIEQ